LVYLTPLSIAALIPEHGWSWNIPLIMLVSFLVALPITRWVTREPDKGQNLVPIPLPLGLKWPQLLTAASLAHVIGFLAVFTIRYTDFL